MKGSNVDWRELIPLYQKLSANQSIKLASDFSMLAMKRGYPEGMDIPVWYLLKWLPKNYPKGLKYLPMMIKTNRREGVKQ